MNKALNLLVVEKTIALAVPIVHFLVFLFNFSI